jgi:hypothetical protein
MIVAATARLDDIGKPAWIAVMVLGFIIWWPVGLAILGFMIWSGRMGCGRAHWGRWRNERWGGRFERGEGQWRGRGGSHSGNSAFEDYKAETLRRLEDEQKEFLDFLRRLRESKDKAEFDQFMNERRNRPQTPDTAPDSPASPQS